MSDLEKDALEKMAKSNDDSMRFVAKDMMNLARMLGKTPYEDKDGNTDRFTSNLVQASFYLTAYTIAARSFNAMVGEKNEDPKCDKKSISYMLDEVLRIIGSGAMGEEDDN